MSKEDVMRSMGWELDQPTPPKDLEQIYDCSFCDGERKLWNLKTEEYEVCPCVEKLKALLAWSDQRTLAAVGADEQRPSTPTVVTNQAVNFSERATMLITSAAMLWSPITRGEIFELLVYMVKNFDEVIGLIGDEPEANTDTANKPKPALKADKDGGV